MIPGVNGIQDPGSGVLKLTLNQSSDTVTAHDDPSVIIGRLDARCTKILRVLQESGLVLQAFVKRQNLSDARRSSTARNGNSPNPSNVKLSVNLYGPMRIFDQVGDFLLKCSEYLQAPTDCDRNVYYRNPQSLAGVDQNPPKTLELSSRDLLSQIETISQGTDPSAVLETRDILKESEAPAILQSDLYRCVPPYSCL